MSINLNWLVFTVIGLCFLVGYDLHLSIKCYLMHSCSSHWFIAIGFYCCINQSALQTLCYHERMLYFLFKNKLLKLPLTYAIKVALIHRSSSNKTIYIHINILKFFISVFSVSRRQNLGNIKKKSNENIIYYFLLCKKDSRLDFFVPIFDVYFCFWYATVYKLCTQKNGKDCVVILRQPLDKTGC